MEREERGVREVEKEERGNRGDRENKEAKERGEREKEQEERQKVTGAIVPSSLACFNHTVPFQKIILSLGECPRTILSSVLLTFFPNISWLPV